jgi:hypothetical protein
VRLESEAQARLAESRRERAMLQQRVESSMQTGNDEEDSHSRGEQTLQTESEADGDTNREK